MRALAKLGERAQAYGNMSDVEGLEGRPWTSNPRRKRVRWRMPYEHSPVGGRTRSQRSLKRPHAESSESHDRPLIAAGFASAFYHFWRLAQKTIKIWHFP